MSKQEDIKNSFSEISLEQNKTAKQCRNIKLLNSEPKKNKSVKSDRRSYSADDKIKIDSKNDKFDIAKLFELCAQQLMSDVLRNNKSFKLVECRSIQIKFENLKSIILDELCKHCKFEIRELIKHNLKQKPTRLAISLENKIKEIANEQSTKCFWYKLNASHSNNSASCLEEIYELVSFMKSITNNQEDYIQIKCSIDKVSSRFNAIYEEVGFESKNILKFKRFLEQGLLQKLDLFYNDLPSLENIMPDKINNFSEELEVDPLYKMLSNVSEFEIDYQALLLSKSLDSKSQINVSNLNLNTRFPSQIVCEATLQTGKSIENKLFQIVKNGMIMELLYGYIRLSPENENSLLNFLNNIFIGGKDVGIPAIREQPLNRFLIYICSGEEINSAKEFCNAYDKNVSESCFFENLANRFFTKPTYIINENDSENKKEIVKKLEKKQIAFLNISLSLHKEFIIMNNRLKNIENTLQQVIEDNKKNNEIILEEVKKDNENTLKEIKKDNEATLDKIKKDNERVIKNNESTFEKIKKDNETTLQEIKKNNEKTLEEIKLLLGKRTQA